MLSRPASRRRPGRRHAQRRARRRERLIVLLLAQRRQLLLHVRLRRLSELRGDDATRTPAERLVEGRLERVTLAQHRLQIDIDR